ncbi:hypothetical protein SLE2022_154120 [Rubroshorea leprosula]
MTPLPLLLAPEPGPWLCWNRGKFSPGGNVVAFKERGMVRRRRTAFEVLHQGSHVRELSAFQYPHTSDIFDFNGSYIQHLQADQRLRTTIPILSPPKNFISPRACFSKC